MYVMLYVLMSI